MLRLRGANFKVKWDARRQPSAAPRDVEGPRPGTLARRDRVPPDRQRDGGTRFDYRNEFKAPLGPLGAVASHALVGGLPAKEADASLRKLKALMEGGRR